MSESPNLGLPFLAAGQAQKHVTLNGALSVLDALVQLSVLRADLTAPPASPAEGDRYIVAAPPAGGWAGQARAVAVFEGGAWEFHAPDEGWLAWNRASNTLLVYDGAAWIDLPVVITALQSLSRLGVGATADATNPVSTKGGVLHDADPATGDQRTGFNKATPADDLALTFQTGFSARALIGLLGSDDLTVKVSPDGSTYFDAMVLDKDTGAASLPANPKFSAWVNFDKYVPADTWTNIGANNTRHNDQDGFAASAGLFTAPHAGYYAFGAGYTFKANAAVPTLLRVGLSVNGAAPTLDARSVQGDATLVTLETSLSVNALLKLSAGDTVAAVAYMATNDGYVLADQNYFWGHEIA